MSQGRLNRRRWVCLIGALLVMALCWVKVLGARQGLVVRSLQRDSVPLLYLAPKQAQRNVPAVLVAHGFAGSKQLMLGYGHVLARNGYAVMLLDFDGHGSNGYPFQRNDLEDNLNTAWQVLREQPEWDAKHLASVGHSLGTYATLSAAVHNPASFAATVAIAPVPAPVNFRFPRNLQLQVGQWETEAIKRTARILLRSADSEGNIPSVDRSPASRSEDMGPVEQVLEQAEQQRQAITTTLAETAATAQQQAQALSQGSARSLIEIPRVEHIGILFSDRSHQATLDWLNATFDLAAGSPSSDHPYRDRRLVWFGLHWLSGLVALGAIAPTLGLQTRVWKRPLAPWRKQLGLLVAPGIAWLGLVLAEGRGADLQTLGGIQVGSAVALWLLLGGCSWLGILGRIPRPRPRALAVGAAIFVALWFSFGALAQITWLNWLLISARLPLWPLFSLTCFPWFLASGIAQQGCGAWGRLGWWLGQSLALVLGFLLVIYSLPQLGFLILLLPFFPMLTAMFTLVAHHFDEPWAYGLGCSLFFAWALAASFPLG